MANKTFVISGIFENYSRTQLKKMIVQYGGKVVSGISRKVDFLLAGKNMGAVKKEKAEKLQISIISETAFLAMIEN